MYQLELINYNVVSQTDEYHDFKPSWSPWWPLRSRITTLQVIEVHCYVHI